MWRRIFSAPDPADDEGLIAVVDYKTGRVVRIPGEFPWTERLKRHKWRYLAALFFIACGLVGLATAAPESAADCAAPRPGDNTMPVGTAADTFT